MTRTDIPSMKKLLSETGTKLYRGTGLTKKELKSYKDLVGKIEKYKSNGVFISGYMAMMEYLINLGWIGLKNMAAIPP